MLFLSYLFLVFCFLKGIFYGIYEIKESNNKLGGIIFIFICLIGLILPVISLMINY